MRIAVFGKFPPIQGGVSTDVFEFVESVAVAGHTIHVITNSLEVELGVRATLKQNDRERINSLSSQVVVHYTTSLQKRVYVPYANPFLSKLIGIGHRVFSEIKFDLVVGWYLEPYGVAAATVSLRHDTPLFLKTAGSDIGKLSYHPELGDAYSFVLQRSFVIFGGKPGSTGNRRLLELGASEENIVTLRTCALPRYYQRPARPIELNWRDEIECEALPATDRAEVLKNLYIEFNDVNRYCDEFPTIGVFGKVGESKGTYDLLSAFEQLSREGHKYNILWIPAGVQEVLENFFSRLEKLRLVQDNVVVLPPVVPWQIPNFLARCDIACVLEREFPVEFHGPRLPREILASGTALVLSREIADKQSFAENLVHGKNCLIVEDPRNVASITNAIGMLISDRNLTRYISKHGKYLSEAVEGFLDLDNSMLSAISDLAEENIPEGSD